MAYRPVSWQRNYLRTPNHVRDAVARISADEIQLAARLSLRASDAGKYSHLGIAVNDDGTVSVANRVVLPPPEMGKWSTTNIHGHEVVRKDLPKVPQTRGMETPNFGDWSKGSHTIYITQDVYPRDHIPPKQAALEIEIVAENPAEGTTEVLVRVDQPLNKNDPTFEADLFYLLNILQENTGAVGVIPAGVTTEEYLRTLAVDWEILPPGDRESNLAVIVGRGRSVSESERRTIAERYQVLESLKPTNFIAGTSGFRRYYGAQFADDLVVFENVEYGNAAYVMGENWKELSQLSRTELLARAQRDFDRIVHKDAWKQRLRAVVRDRIRERRKRTN